MRERKTPTDPSDRRKQRLSSALKANLQKRKSQARARSTVKGEDKSESDSGTQNKT